MQISNVKRGNDMIFQNINYIDYIPSTYGNLKIWIHATISKNKNIHSKNISLPKI